MRCCVVVCFVLLFGGIILLSSSLIQAEAAADGGARGGRGRGGGVCGSGCRARCAVAGMQDRCLKYCGICCSKCGCVPKGTYGNKHQCPCYRDMLNSKGKPKCP